MLVVPRSRRSLLGGVAAASFMIAALAERCMERLVRDLLD